MKKDLFIHNAFANTTVDVQKVYNFLRQCPNHQAGSVLNGTDDRELELADNVNYCMMLFRRYLLGILSTSEYVYDEIGGFLQFEPLEAPTLLQSALELIEYQILTEEWYELMPRFQTIRQQIHEIFNL